MMIADKAAVCLPRPLMTMIQFESMVDDAFALLHPGADSAEWILQVTVLRDGRTQEISTFDLLVGDVLLVDTGDILAADGLLAQGNDLR